MAYLTRLYFSCWHERIIRLICSNNHPSLQNQLQIKVVLFLGPVLKISSDIALSKYYSNCCKKKKKPNFNNLLQPPFSYMSLCSSYMDILLLVTKINYCFGFFRCSGYLGQRHARRGEQYFLIFRVHVMLVEFLWYMTRETPLLQVDTSILLRIMVQNGDATRRYLFTKFWKNLKNKPRNARSACVIIFYILILFCYYLPIILANWGPKFPW